MKTRNKNERNDLDYFCIVFCLEHEKSRHMSTARTKQMICLHKMGVGGCSSTSNVTFYDSFICRANLLRCWTTNDPIDSNQGKKRRRRRSKLGVRKNVIGTFQLKTFRLISFLWNWVYLVFSTKLFEIERGICMHKQ